MRLDRRTKIQLVVFTLISLLASGIMIFRYIDAPAMLFGIGHYTVTVDLQRAAGLYPSANVTYRGSEVGRVQSVRLTDTGVQAELVMVSGIKIPAQLQAQVHSRTAIGEQYVELLPRSGDGPSLKDGDVIPVDATSVPPDIGSLLDATNRGLTAIPQGNLKTVIDESYNAVGGLGPELSRLVKGSTELAIGADKSLQAVTTVIDQSAPILHSQSASGDSIRAWSAHLANITDQVRSRDRSVAALLHNGGAAADEGRRLFRRLQPTLPLLLANLVSVADVAVTYQPALEQLLVLLPQAVAVEQGTETANLNTKQAYKGLFLDFNLNLNLPPICTTGFLPPQQQRAVSYQDYPNRPAGNLYCRVPQDSPFNVRGARNYPCLTVPGKRAPTVKMCESKEQYVPLNDGYNWKGDPNATLSGQAVPQLPPGSAPLPNSPAPASSPLPIAAAEYDPATGNYVGPNGRVYSQSDLSQTEPKERTWQSMLLPPKS